MVFTEHGVLQLANVLRSERANQVSIRIIEIFMKMRELLLSNKDLLLKIEQLEQKTDRHDDDIQLVIRHLQKLLEPTPKPRRKVGYKSATSK